jgi:hypothetical protein
VTKRKERREGTEGRWEEREKWRERGEKRKGERRERKMEEREKEVEKKEGERKDIRNAH